MKVTIIAAATICGRIGPGLAGSPVDRALLEQMRAATGASLMGAETLRQADPEMRGPEGHLRPGRIRAVITCSGNINGAGKKLFAHGEPPLIFTSLAAAPGLRLSLGQTARVEALPEVRGGELCLATALARLAESGVSSLLVEGGGRLHYSCLRQGIVDEIMLTITPQISGDLNAASLCSGQASLGAPFLPLLLVSSEALPTGELLVKYRVKKEEPA